jgi:hypothetical protein
MTLIPSLTAPKPALQHSLRGGWKPDIGDGGLRNLNKIPARPLLLVGTAVLVGLGPHFTNTRGGFVRSHEEMFSETNDKSRQLLLDTVNVIFGAVGAFAAQSCATEAGILSSMERDFSSKIFVYVPVLACSALLSSIGWLFGFSLGRAVTQFCGQPVKSLNLLLYPLWGLLKDLHQMISGSKEK